MDINDEYLINEAQREAKLGVFIYDIKREIWTTTKILDEMLGIDDNYAKTFQGWLNLIHPSQRTEMEARISETIRTGSSFNYEYKVINQTDGTEMVLMGKGKVYFNEYGMLDKIAGTVHDITEFKKSEERYKKLSAEVEQQKAFLVNLINTVPDLIFYKDTNSVYIGCNKAFEAFTGKKEKDIVGQTDLEIFDKETAQLFRTMDLKTMEQREHCKNEEWVKYPNGKSVLLETIKTPYYDNQGGILGIIGVSRDITERIKKEELQKSAEEDRKRLIELQEIDRIKTEFFANISHELKTPINVIFSSLQMQELMIKNNSYENSNIDKFKYVKMMKQNCYRLMRLISNLIDLTKIDTDYLQINEVNQDIVSLIENVTLSVADYIENKGISVTFDTDVEEKIIAYDPEKVERIILNLLSNSVKFTPPGGNIVITIEDQCNEIYIKVKDTGRGIPEDKLNAIFERFVQVDKSFARTQEGSGIGLSIVKALVELHGGTISVASREWQGAEFTIKLPCRLVDDETYPQSACNAQIGGNYIEKINIEFSDIYN